MGVVVRVWGQGVYGNSVDSILLHSAKIALKINTIKT